MSKEIQLTQGRVAICDDDDFPFLSTFNWCAIRKDGRFYATTGDPATSMHRMLLGCSPGDGVKGDHKNGDGLDNRRLNLRPANNAQNGRNRKMHRNNRSGFKGISWHKRDRLWHAKICVNGKGIHLGCFATPEKAHAAYCSAAVTYHGEFARLA